MPPQSSDSSTKRDGDWLAGAGPAADRLRSTDWSTTTLGPRDGWPHALRMSVNLCINTPYPLLVWWGPDQRQFANDAAVAMLGPALTEPAGTDAKTLWREAWAQIEPLVALEQVKASWSRPIRVSLADDGITLERQVVLSIIPLFDESGRAAGMFLAPLDESLRLKSEREREQLARQLQLALNAAQMGWWHYDPITRVATWDERYKEIFGVVGSQRPNEEILARLHPDDLPGVLAAVDAALNPVNPRPYTAEYRVLRDDGGLRWVEAHGLATFEGTGDSRRAVSFVGTVADISARKQVDEDLRTLNRTLEERVEERTAEARRRAAQLQTLAGELTRAESRERQRVAKVLHDHLQQLLVAAMMRTTLLRGEVVTDAGLQYVQAIQDALSQSIDSARTLTVELSPPVLHSAGLAAAMAWLGRWMRDKHHLEVDVQADPAADPGVEDLRSFLFQSARELLFNVVKHAKVPRARVTLSRSAEGAIELTVEDAGPGMDVERALERHAAGAGFGLFSIRERADLLGGRLTIRSVSGRGTTVKLALPLLAGEELPGLPPLPAPPVSPPLETPASRVIRLLLVDDHKIVRQGLASILSRQPEVNIVGEAADGLEAVDLARRLRPDVILMDINMPNMDGIEATRMITSGVEGVRVIGLSMHQDPEVNARMNQAGAVAYLPKDCPAQELIRTIRQFDPHKPA